MRTVGLDQWGGLQKSGDLFLAEEAISSARRRGATSFCVSNAGARLGSVWGWYQGGNSATVWVGEDERTGRGQTLAMRRDRAGQNAGGGMEQQRISVVVAILRAAGILTG